MQTVTQLPMFIAPRDWANLITSGDEGGTMDEGVMEYKMKEVTGGFVASIEASGVQRPLLLCTSEVRHRANGGEFTLADGHHRFAVAYDLDLIVPVAFASDYQEMADSWRIRELDHVL